MAYYFTDRNTTATYFTTMVKWIGKIKEKFEPWHSRWHNLKDLDYPMLYFKQKGDTTIVFDSRSDKTVEHVVNPVGTQILDLMVKLRRVADLAKELSHVPHLDLEQEITLLQSRGLLFQEGERFLSLVLPKEPPKPNSSAIGGFAL